MNTLPPPALAAPAPPASPSDDAYDDSYAWVGYESADPLFLSLAEPAPWAGADDRRAG